MNFKNMKIPVENNLDEIVGELEKRGYVKYHVDENPNIVLAKEHGTYSCYRFSIYDSFNMISLAELKGM